MEDLTNHPRIRSYVRRQGRMTVAQKEALEQLSSQYQWQGDAPTAPWLLEIGFGDGTAFLHRAALRPNWFHLGAEVHRPGVGRVMMEAHKLGLDNLRVTDTDAVELLATLPDTCLDEVILEFPDPWHKNKHHKRRLLNAEFAQSLRPKLKIGGLFRLATDWEDYAQQIQSVLNAAEGFQNLSPDQTVVPRPDDRPTTRFEARGARLGHGVWDFAYRRTG